MIRQFKIRGLTNNITLDLNDFNKFLLVNPAGLGIAITNSYIRVLNKRINIKREKKYEPITATIEVTGETRSDWEWNYNELRDFIIANRNDGFELYYKNVENEERYVNCDIKLLAKTEKTTYGILVPIELEIRSNWLSDQQFTVEVSTDDEKGLGFFEETVTDSDTAQTEVYYDYGFLKDIIGIETQYDYKFIKGLKGEVEITNNGNEETPLLITITSQCYHPLITLLNANGEVVQSCKVNVQVSNGERLVINSDPENLDIYLVSSYNQIVHCVDALDLTTNGFIMLPVGTYTLVVSDDNENPITGDVSFSLQYLGG